MKRYKRLEEMMLIILALEIVAGNILLAVWILQ